MVNRDNLWTRQLLIFTLPVSVLIINPVLCSWIISRSLSTSAFFHFQCFWMQSLLEHAAYVPLGTWVQRTASPVVRDRTLKQDLGKQGQYVTSWVKSGGTVSLPTRLRDEHLRVQCHWFRWCCIDAKLGGWLERTTDIKDLLVNVGTNEEIWNRAGMKATSK